VAEQSSTYAGGPTETAGLISGAERYGWARAAEWMPHRRRFKLSGMAHWYESAIERSLREATERGEFDNLPGSGKPLSDHGREYDDDWWVKDWLRREGATAGVIP